MILFLVLRLLDLATTAIGISLGVSEGNTLQAILMNLGPFYYPLNLILSVGLYLVLSRFRIGRTVLIGFMFLNVIVIMTNLMCIVFAIIFRM